jgi:hypothetical protein
MLDSIDSNRSPDSGDRRAESSAPPRPAISKSEIEYVNRVYRKIRATHAETAVQVIDLGDHLNKMQARLLKREGYGKWKGWVEANLDFPIRTARKFGWAADNRHLLAALGPEEFMARVWGHRPKTDEPEPREAASGPSGEVKTGTNGTGSEGTKADEVKEGDGEPFDDKADDSKPRFRKPKKLVEGEWEGIEIHRNLFKTIEAYLTQPGVARTIKLKTVVEIYLGLEKVLDRTAAECGLTAEQALKLK